MAYEDFTTYTEVDEGNDLTVDSSTKVSWLNLLSRSETAYLYKDKGIDYFNGDFTHKFEMEFSYIGDKQQIVYWMISNLVADLQGVVSQSGDAHSIFVYDNSLYLYLRLIENGSEINDTFRPLLNTRYYIEVVRDDDAGPNSTGLVLAYVRTGSHTGTLLDTLSVGCSAGEQNDFRYLYGVATKDDNDNVGVCHGYTQNLDIETPTTTTSTSTSTSTTVTISTSTSTSTTVTISTTTSPPSVSKTLVFVVSS